MSTQSDEKRELLKLKQGLIDESEIIKEEEKKAPEKLHGMARFENFMYHNKWYVIVGLFFIVLSSIFAWQMLTKEKEDMTVLLVTSDNTKTPDLYRKAKEFELAIEQYCPDFDNNGNVHVSVYFIDLTKSADYQYTSTNTAKFFGEMERGVSELFICDTGIFNISEDENHTEEEFGSMFMRLARVTGDEKWGDRRFENLNRTELVKDANWESSCPDSMKIGVKQETPDMISYSDRAVKYNKEAQIVMKNILENNKINEMKSE